MRLVLEAKKPLASNDENEVLEDTLSYVTAMQKEIPSSCTLHFKSLKKARQAGDRDCYVWDQANLYYIHEDCTIDTVPITDPQKLLALNTNDEQSSLTLSEEQIQTFINENGGNISVFSLKEEKVDSVISQVINFFSFFSRSIANNGNNIAKLFIAIGNAGNTLKNVQFGFKSGGLIPAIIDFFELPIIVMEAIILGKKLPTNLSNTTRWFYAVGTLALTLASVLTPSISIIITLTIAAYTLGIGLLNFIELSYDFYQTKKILKSTAETIPLKQSSLGQMREQALKLRLELEKLITSANSDDSLGEQKQLINQLNALKLNYDKEKKELQQLNNLRKLHRNKQTAMSMSVFLVQILVLSLRVLAVIGAALVFCTPVIGNTLMVLSGLLITAILIQPIVTSLVGNMINWAKTLCQKNDAANDNNEIAIDWRMKEIMQSRHGDYAKPPPIVYIEYPYQPIIISPPGSTTPPGEQQQPYNGSQYDFQ